MVRQPDSPLIFAHYKNKRRWNRVCSFIDEYQKLYGEKISNLIIKYGNHSSGELSDADYEKMAEDLQNFLTESCAGVSKIFSAFTGKKCHTSIKTYSNETDLISPRARDNIADDLRSGTDEILENYLYKENTAFKNIIDDPNTSSFTNNWLRLSSALGKYRNYNQEWKKHYRATLVVPITEKTMPESIDKNSIWGFLCVDNKGGGFSTGADKYLLSSFARIYLNIFFALSIYKKEPVSSWVKPS